MLLRFVSALTLMAVVACDTPLVVSPDADAVADVADIRKDLGLPDADPPEILDSSAADSQIGDTEPTPAPSFAVGTNPFGVSDPAQFVALEAGSDFRVEKGTQGAWMVVVAARTAGMLSGDVDLEARLWVAGVDEGGVIRSGLKPIRAGDGYDYLYSLPLIVNGPELAGQDANLVVKASDNHSGSAEQTVAIHLTGGTTP